MKNTNDSDRHITGLVEAAAKIESIVDNNDVCGILRAFGRRDVADELSDWIDQLSAHRLQVRSGA